MKVRKLERVLKAIDTGDYSGSEIAPANVCDAVELKPQETVEPVLPDKRVAAKVSDDQLQVARQLPEQRHSFELVINDDFKWDRDDSCDHHPGCPTSLP